MFAWWSTVTATDTLVVRAQLGKAPRSMVAVARRCRFGLPQVIVTSPVVLGPGRRSEKRAGVEATDLRVFPTTYWLTCPYLVTAVSRLEGDGWIGRLHAWLESTNLTATMAAANQRAATERVALVEPHLRAKMLTEQPAQWQVLAAAGIGGARNQSGVKCLHSHLADYLAGPVGAERGLAGAELLGEHAECAPGARNPVGARVLTLLLWQGVDITGWPECNACQVLRKPVQPKSQQEETASPEPEKAPAHCRAVSHVAVLDVGTNSCRLLLNQLIDGRLVRCHAALKTTRLGEGLEATGRLSLQAVQRTIDGLRFLQREASAGAETAAEPTPPASQTIVVATNAVRSSSNPESILIPAWEELGLAVRVISGEEEAALSFRGALSGLLCNRPSEGHETTGDSSMYCEGLVGVLDIGGGSTELVVGDWSGTPRWSGSVNIGAVRLAELAARQSSDVPTLVQRATTTLQAGLAGGLSAWRSSGALVGVGGTCTTLAAIDLGLAVYKSEMVQGHVLTYNRVCDIAAMLSKKTWAERQNIPGLQPERADIIVPGSAILLAAMQLLDQKQVIVSDSDILLGAAQVFINACVDAGYGV